jgi:hypothetical protein
LARAEAERLAQIEKERLERAKPVSQRVKEKIAEVQASFRLKDEEVILRAYEAAIQGYNLKFYGYINFGDGKGNLELTKDEFFEYAKYFKITK